MAPTKPSKQAAPAAAGSGSGLPPARLAKNPRLPATMFAGSGSGAGASGPATGSVSGKKQDAAPVAHAHTRPTALPAKKSKTTPTSRKQRLKSELGKEKALERAAALAEKVKGREERKAKRNRAKKAWE